MCSRSQCHRLWWMARRRFSHETQMANCLPSGLVKTKGKNSSIFFGRLSIVWFVFIVVNFVVKLLYLFDVWFKNWINESSFKMILSLCSTPRRDRNGIFYLPFPRKICWSVPCIDGDKMIWLKMKRKEKRCWGQIKFHTKSIKPKHKFVNLNMTYAKLGLINESRNRSDLKDLKDTSVFSSEKYWNCTKFLEILANMIW